MDELENEYQEAAQQFLHSLPLEHFMETTAQATQRKFTLESLDLVHARNPDVQFFNELLVQYPHEGGRRLGQVVPDNMVVVWHEPIKADCSFDLPFQPVVPFWVLDYVSKGSKRKNYVDNFNHFEQALKVPYYLVFCPDKQDLTLCRLERKGYVSVPPDKQGRHPIPELEMEVALLNGWVRFWFRRELLLLPAELQQELVDARSQLAAQQRRQEQESGKATKEKQLADSAKQRADQLEREFIKERDARVALEKKIAELQARIDGQAKESSS